MHTKPSWNESSPCANAVRTQQPRTLRVGRHRLTLTWRAPVAVASLLMRLLRRALARPARSGPVTSSPAQLRYRFHLPAVRLSRTGAASGVVVLLASGTATAGGVPVTALPAGGALIAGQANIAQAGNRLTVVQGSQNAILNWNSFDIGSGASVNVVQPNAGAMLLNRVMSNSPSALQGALTANGRVWIINPAGIMVGAGARIDVAGFVASTLQVSDSDFLANRMTFGASAAAGAGAVQNYGQISASQGGGIYLIGSTVGNTGILRAPGGEVILGAGQHVILADPGTPGVKVDVTGAAGNVTNLGQIVSNAGRIGLAGAFVTNHGELDASSVMQEGGRIFLLAGDSLVTGSQSRLAADGITGGSIRLSADNAADINGSVSAQGSGGHGGFVETSGRNHLSVVGAPVIGHGGQWLIDPNDITIQATGPNANVTPGPAYSSTGDGAIISTGSIETALNGGTSVTVTTGSTGPSSQAGNITVADSITKSAGTDAVLTLNAFRDININAPITSTSGALNLTLKPDSYNAYGGKVNIGSSISLNNGAMAVNGPARFSNAAVSNMTLSISGAIEFAGNTVLNADLNANTVLLSGGVLEGSGALQAQNLTWTGGTIRGAAADPAYVAHNLSTTGSLVLDGRTLNIDAAGVSTFTNGALALNNSATLRMDGETHLSGYTLGSLSGTTGASNIVNNGLLIAEDTSGAPQGSIIGSAYDSGNQTFFRNNGQVALRGSSLQIGGNGFHTGQFTITPGAAGSTSTLRFGSAQDSPSLYLSQAIEGTIITADNAGGGGTAVVAFGTGVAPQAGQGNQGVSISLDADITASHVGMSNGYLEGNGTLTVQNFDWSGGRIRGSQSGATIDATNFTASGTLELNNRVLNLQAGGTSSIGNANLTLNNSATLNNAGTIHVTNAVIGATSGSAASSIITNSGLIAVEGAAMGAPQSTVIGSKSDVANGAAFNNAGTVRLENGSLQLGGDGVHSGAFVIVASDAANRLLQFGSQSDPLQVDTSQTLAAGSSIVQVNSNGGSSVVAFGHNASPQPVRARGPSRLQASPQSKFRFTNVGFGISTTTVDTDLNLSTLTFSDGILQGRGHVTAGDLIWSGGTIRGTATDPALDVTRLLVVPGTAFAVPASKELVLDSRAVRVAPGGTVSLAAPLRMAGSAVISAPGTDVLNTTAGMLTGTGSFLLGGTGSLINDGVVAPGTMQSGTAPLGFGTINPTGTSYGTFFIDGGFTQHGTGTLDFKVASATQYDSLQTNGPVRLAGNVSANAVNGFVAGPGDVVSLITRAGTGTRTGGFDTVVLSPGLQAFYDAPAGTVFGITAAGGPVPVPPDVPVMPVATVPNAPASVPAAAPAAAPAGTPGPRSEIALLEAVTIAALEAPVGGDRGSLRSRSMRSSIVPRQGPLANAAAGEQTIGGAPGTFGGPPGGPVPRRAAAGDPSLPLCN